MATIYHLTIPTSSGGVPLNVSTGRTILVAGPNGVGKSALLSDLYRLLPSELSTYLPGHRQINFNQGWESAGQDGAQLRINLYTHVEAFSRFKGAWAEDQFKLTIRTLMNAENSYNRSFRIKASKGTTEISYRKAAALRESPLDKLNSVFSAAKFQVQFLTSDMGIEACKGTSVYAIDALSDGERAALFVASAIISQPANSIVLIDEPEKHLHPSITGLLVDACLRMRPDVGTILSSHDVSLIEGLTVDQVIHVRDSTVTQVRPEHREYAIDVIEKFTELSEDLKRDLLGSRSTILFVEGEQTSNDLALYALVYPDIKISPRGGHDKVTEAVSAFKRLGEEHWLAPFGIIDGDGRNRLEKEALKQKSVFVLPSPSIENLFFLNELIICFIEANASYRPGLAIHERQELLSVATLAGAKKHRAEIIAKRLSWTLERELNCKKLSPKDILSGKLEPIEISLDELNNRVANDIDKILAKNSSEDILRYMPIKKTSIPEAVAKSIGALNFDEYCKVVLRQIESRSPSGARALSALRRVLPKLKGLK